MRRDPQFVYFLVGLQPFRAVRDMECTPGKKLMEAKDFLEAETECRKDSDCMGIYEFCERSNKFFACHQGFTNKTSLCKSVLYLKGTSISYSTNITLSYLEIVHK